MIVGNTQIVDFDDAGVLKLGNQLVLLQKPIESHIVTGIRNLA